MKMVLQLKTTYNGDGTSTQNVTTSSGSKGTFTIDENGRAKDIKNVDMAKLRQLKNMLNKKQLKKLAKRSFNKAFKKHLPILTQKVKIQLMTLRLFKRQYNSNVAQVSPYFRTKCFLWTNERKKVVLEEH